MRQAAHEQSVALCATWQPASVQRLFNHHRVALAQKLLREQSQLAIAELYLEAGFATKSHFHREFSRVTGQSPGAYRKEAIGA